MTDSSSSSRPSVKSARIAGVACAVPGLAQAIVTQDSADLRKIVALTGVSSRHVATNNICTSDLCEVAARQLLEATHWSPESIDLLVFVSQTPDAVLPATACILHGKLGLRSSCAAFDVNLGCSGYVYGLHLVASLISAGQARRALLLVGDTISKITCDADRSVAYLFGDAGSATAVEFQEAASPLAFVLGTDGTGAEHLQVPSGGFRQPRSAETAVVRPAENGNQRSAENLFMNGAEIFNFTIARVPVLADAVTTAAGWAIQDVDLWVFHQANRFMLDHLIKRLKLPRERCILELERFGNTSSASIPMALVTGAREPLASGQLKLVLAGFGVGFSWAAVAWHSDNPLVLPLISVD